MDDRAGPALAPARMWFALLRRLGRGVTGRRFTVRGSAFTVASLHGLPEGARWGLGRARDVEVVLRDLVAPELTARELVVACETLTVGTAVTATGVSITATMTPESVRAMGDGAGPEITVVGGELRSSSFVPGVEVVVEPQVADDHLRFVPVALLTPFGRWSSWWLPAATAPHPDLPGGLRLAGIAIGDDALVLRVVVDRWSAPLRDGSRLRELLVAAKEAPAEPGVPAPGRQDI